MSSSPTLIPSLKSLIDEISSDFEQISEDRKKELTAFATEIGHAIRLHGTAKLNFICTHNSRRSHLSQVTAQTAAAYYGIEAIECYSGGTEATACNARTVAAFEQAGFKVTKTTDSDNPVYEISFANGLAPLRAWSKVYNDEANPSADYLAIMTCNHADQNCPIVQGASKRIPLTFVDPKVSDDTPEEADTYSARLKEIGSQMFFTMQIVSDILPKDAS